MTCSCFPDKLSKLEPVISANLTPGENLLWLCKEHYRPGVFANIIALKPGLDVSRKFGDYTRFTPVTGNKTLALIALIIILAVVIAATVVTQYNYHPKHASCANKLYHFSIVCLPLLTLFMLSIFTERAFAITDKRLICIALPKGKVLWWLNLDKLDTVDVHTRKNDTKDLKLNFSSAPTSTGDIQTSIKEYVLLGIAKPEQLKTLLLANRLSK